MFTVSRVIRWSIIFILFKFSLVLKLKKDCHILWLLFNLTNSLVTSISISNFGVTYGNGSCWKDC